MNVLMHGNTYQQIRCKKCDALLEYTASDIVTHKAKSEEGNFFYEWDFIKCLDCNNTIILDERKIEI